MKKIIYIIVIILVLIVGVYYWKNKTIINSDSSSVAKVDSIKEISQYQYTENYSHPTYNFSFKYPKGFNVTSVPNDKGEVILVQNPNTKVAVQIMVSSFQGGDIDITSDIVKSEIPDMKIDDPQSLLVGISRKGLAFVSDNPAFGGKSREVWFVFKDNLYQISTYYEFDEFLKGVFSTWKFN